MTELLAPRSSGNREFNVMAYGAKGDGVADDQPGIAAAILAASNYGGANNCQGLVVFPPGKYKINSVVRLYGNISLMCHGAYIFNGGVYNSSFYIMFSIDPAGAVSGYGGYSNISVYGGIFDGKGQDAPFTTSGPPASGKSIFHFGAGRNFYFKDVIMRNVASFHAMDIKGVDGLVIDGCRFEGFIDNNTPAARNMSEAIQLEQGWDNTTPCINVKVTNCYAGPAIDGSGLGSFGKLVGSHNDPTGVYYENIVVANNNVVSPLENGIGFYSLRNSVISNNTISGAGRDGIRLTAGNTGTTSTNFNNVISGNVIRGSAQHGISLEACNRNTITGNFIYDTGAGGIGVSAPYTAFPTLSGTNTTPSPDNTISGNTIIGTSRNATYGSRGCIDISGAANTKNFITGNSFRKYGSSPEANAPIYIRGVNAADTYIINNAFGSDWSTDYLTNIATSNASFNDNAKIRTLVLASPVTYTNTITPATVTGMSFWADANSKYEIEAVIAVKVVANSGSDEPDVRTDWDGPSGIGGSRLIMGPVGASTVTTYNARDDSNGTYTVVPWATDIKHRIDNNNTQHFILTKGVLTTSSTAGTVSLRAAQNSTSSTSDTIVDTGTYITYRKLDI